ncbi:MAG: DUF4091 domain-containing protein [Myxococcales bacterium]|nr:DUF4091 domain-containing protein [Myxococcales bacterium]
MRRTHQLLYISSALATGLLSACADLTEPGELEPEANEAVQAAATSALAAADLTVGVAPSSQKVRPTMTPPLAATASLKAARNEFEAFQLILKAGATTVSNVSVQVGSLTGPGGASIPAANVALYAERYYKVFAEPSNDEPANAEDSWSVSKLGEWPDALVPDVDTYFREKRNAFPLTVPANANRAVWVELLVPQNQVPGTYTGSVTVLVNGVAHAVVPVSLRVGAFTLPSTPSLRSAFSMKWDEPAAAHGITADEPAAQLRALYVRSALEHRLTIATPIDGLPSSPAALGRFTALTLPMLKGTSSARLPGAKLTTVFHREMTDTDVSAWITFANAHGFYDRLYFYPVDEPTWAGDPAAAWNTFKLWSDKVHAIDASSRIILTASMQDAVSRNAATKIDAFVPIINELEDRSGAYAGSQRAKYDAWMSGAAKREMWGYQACPSHGCGMPVGCGTPSKGIEHTGWPNLMIDTSSVQVRAFGWQSFRFRVTNELFWDIASMLNTSWTNQCSYGGHGEGTFFYTGTPARVGGTSHIPVESIRLKMMREGREDYEYLAMVARTNPALANSVANTLFPHSYASAQTAAALERARSQLFDYLDAPALAAEVDRTARIVAGTLQVRSELPAPGTWTSVATNVAGVRLAGDRIVLRKNDNSVWAKEGGLVAGAFVQLAPAGAAVEIAAAGRLIALRSSAGKIEVKDGSLTSPWVVYVASGAKKVVVSGCGVAGGNTVAAAEAACAAAARVGYIDAANTARVRTPAGAWSQIATSVADLQFFGDFSVLRTISGTLRYHKEGTWVDIATGVTGVTLGRDSLAFTKATPAAGSLYTMSNSNLGTPFAETPKFQLSNVLALQMGIERFAIRLGTGALQTNQYPETQWATPWRAEGSGSMIVVSRACSTMDLAGEGYVTSCY